ncbi:uncharacterized protein LOC120014819 [Tripterygium wilfordii]|uniref:uncharacterized protein LOC120014819 n=1 Tax=Tripterygium wilfordii TaxID=458696 RepID=UPI0018F83219|nr:uncharacterized protein LOC120014819 [Tripterygium wilfordii]
MPESENPKMEQEEEEKQPNSSSPPPPTSADDPPSEQPSTQTNAPPFDPSRMIGIIKRKALIKELAAVYHAQCLSYCQELLELQKKWEEPFVDTKTPDDSRKETTRRSKRVKKSR